MCYQPAREDSDDERDAAAADDRDMRMMRLGGQKAAGRGVGRADGPRVAAWGGALRRITEGATGPAREDGPRYVDVPGRYVPVGFGRYVAPTVDPGEYDVYQVAGWRAFVPRLLPGQKVAGLLERIYLYGPASAGYVRLGDALVPAIMGPGDRETLAQSAMAGFESWSLGP